MSTVIERFEKIVGSPMGNSHIFVTISFTADGISGELKVDWGVYTDWVDVMLGHMADIDYQYVFDGIINNKYRLYFLKYITDKLNENNRTIKQGN